MRTGGGTCGTITHVPTSTRTGARFWIGNPENRSPYANLEKICYRRSGEIEAAKSALPLAELRARVKTPPLRNFFAALRPTTVK